MVVFLLIKIWISIENGSIIKVGVTNRAYKNKNKKVEHI